MLSRLTLFVFTGCALFAQNNNGRISGTITDATGSVIAGAGVSVLNQDTRIVQKVATDAAGFYVVPDLPVGTFTVIVEAPGFKKAEKTSYALNDRGTITANFKLEVGAITDSVTVSEVLGETVNTVTGELSNTIDSQQVQDLALNGRNYLQLVSLMPGVALLDEDQMATTTSLSVTTWTANGARPGTAHLMVDGGMNLDSGSNGSQINNVGVDFVQQVSAQTSGITSKVGRNSGGAINAVTKSGSNRFSGGANFAIRNDALDAKDYFAPFKPALRFADFSMNLGGPIRKNRLFFFAGQEFKRIRRFTSPTRVTLPTLAEIGGDFSDRTNTIRYPGTQTPIPNKDLTGLMTPDGKAVMNVYKAMIAKAALYTNTPTGNNATFQVLNPFNWRQDLVKLDWHPNDKDYVYGRWIHDNYDLIDPFGTFNSSALPNTPTLRNRPGYGPQMSYTHTFSPTLINEVKLNASWNGQRTPLQGTDWARESFGFQFPRVFGGNGLYSNGIPDVTVNGFTSYNGPARVFLMSPVTDIAPSDNVTIIHRQHTIAAGVMIVRNRKDQNGRTNYDGTVNFNTSPNANTTGFALSDVVTGNFSTYSEAGSDPVGFFRFTQYEGYGEDNWRLSRNLTLTIGARYSRFVPTYTQANNIATFDPARYNPAQAVSMTAGGLIVPGSGNPYDGLIRAGDGIPSSEAGRVPVSNSALLAAIPTGALRGIYPTYNLLMPNIGFAWSPTGDGKMAVRGGFDTKHDRVQGNLIFSQTALPPFSNSVSYESGNLANPSGGTTSAVGPLGSINAIDTHLKVPAVYNYNLSIERELPHGTFLRVAYAGKQLRHLLRQPDINFPTFDVLVAHNNLPSANRLATNSLRPYKGYSNIRMYLSDANGNYNSLQAFFSKRRGDLTMTAAYTWSHALADGSGDGDNSDGGLSATLSRHYFYGPTSYDRRHILVVTYSYRMPLFRHSSMRIARGALGGWEFSGITRAQSGQWFTAVGSATGITRRADYIGGVVALPSDQRNKDHWFNTAAFATESASALGTAGSGTILGPGLYLWDVSLRKEFHFKERGRIQFRADSFNVMNHVNFRSLQTTTSTTSNFGSLTGSGPARNLQGGLRVDF
jgi:hypothetical protein